MDKEDILLIFAGLFLANNGKTVPEVIASDPEVAARFGTGTQAINHVPGYAVKNVTTVYDWSSLGKQSSKVWVLGAKLPWSWRKT